MKDEHVKGKDVKRQCEEKREGGEYQERTVTEAETDAPDMIVQIGGIISNYILVILTLYLALRYPEFLLVSEAQVLRACKLYNEFQILDQSPLEEVWGFDHIKEYIQSVPVAVFEDNCPDVEET